MSWGQDPSEVKMSGRPASVGLEDRYRDGVYKATDIDRERGRQSEGGDRNDKGCVLEQAYE